MFFIIGDRHGESGFPMLSGKNWKQGKTLQRSDYLFFAGDFGLIFFQNPTESEKYWLDWLNERNWTSLVVDGNHDNIPALYNLPTKEWNGGRVGIIRENILHLRRGEIYTIDEKKYFIFGGAASHDIPDRIQASLAKNPNYQNIKKQKEVQWWKEEMPSIYEMAYGITNLMKHNCSVDYIISHTTPKSIIEQYRNELETDIVTDDPLTKYFDIIKNNVFYKKWYFGHFHQDKTLNDQFVCIFNSIKEIL